MGEIKSTLDIIMEKTKGLTMTKEEKKAFQKKEVEGKVRGFLQKFLEGFMDLERMRKEMAGLGEDRHELAREALLKECIGRIDPGKNNGPILDVLEQLTGKDTHGLRKILSEFHRDLEQQKNNREKILRAIFQEKGISGTAVVPNINADPEWIQYVSDTREGFKSKLDELGKSQK